MRTVPAIFWYLEITKGSGDVDRLEFNKNWRIANFEGGGSPPGQFNTVTNYEIDGAVVSSHIMEPRPIVMGVMYLGAKNQRDYYDARKRLLDFVRPNQYTPVKLYVVLPSIDTYFLEIYGAPGAPLPLTQERSRLFLEPVSFVANNPIWQSVEKLTHTISLASVTPVTAPNQGTIAVATGVNSVTHNQVVVDVGVGAGSGGAEAGYYVEHKKTTEASSAYQRQDVGAQTTHIVSELEELTAYHFRSIPYNSRGSGSASNAVQQATSQFVPHLESPDVSISVTINSITASWPAVTNATGYQARHKLASASTYSSWRSLSSTTYEITGLTRNTAYSISVRATYTANSITTPGPEWMGTETTENAARPGAPRNVEWDSDSRTVSWSAPSSGGPVSFYRVTFAGDAGNGYKDTTSTSATLSTREAGTRTSRYVRVQARGPGGGGPTVTADR